MVSVVSTSTSLCTSPISQIVTAPQAMPVSMKGGARGQGTRTEGVRVCAYQGVETMEDKRRDDATQHATHGKSDRDMGRERKGEREK